LSYKIYLDDNSGNSAQLVYNTLDQSLTNIAFVSDLITGHTYQISVAAFNVIGESLASNELTVHAGVVPS